MRDFASAVFRHIGFAIIRYCACLLVWSVNRGSLSGHTRGRRLRPIHRLANGGSMRSPAVRDGVTVCGTPVSTHTAPMRIRHHPVACRQHIATSKRRKRQNDHDGQTKNRAFLAYPGCCKAFYFDVLLHKLLSLYTRLALSAYPEPVDPIHGAFPDASTFSTSSPLTTCMAETSPETSTRRICVLGFKPAARHVNWLSDTEPFTSSTSTLS